MTFAPGRISVRAEPPYDVVVGSGARSEVGYHVRAAERVAVLHQPTVAAVAAEVIDELVTAGHDAFPIDVPDGEDAKSLEVANTLWAKLAATHIGRTDAIVAVGGGALTDLAGFVSATWLRGVAVVHLPTSLLGMVDAAIGGKSALNTAAGKNLVGAFHNPRAVLADLDLLATLPAEEFASGLAEIVKAGFIDDPAILGLVEGEPSTVAANTDAEVTRELVERAVRVKARVVSNDPLERGQREILNYGHTLGHAIERVAGYGNVRHGQAVSVGMCFAASLARQLGVLGDDALVSRHRTVLESVGLPTTYDADAWDDLYAAMASDKKSRGTKLRFVVLHGLAQPYITEDPDESVLRAAYAEIAE